MYENSLIGAYCNRLYNFGKRHCSFSCYGRIKVYNTAKKRDVDLSISPKISSNNNISKTPKPQLLGSNVVYRLNCSCGSFYIGQTRRNLVKRLHELQTSLNSEVCNHLQSNPNHRVDFNNQQVFISFSDKS